MFKTYHGPSDAPAEMVERERRQQILPAGPSAEVLVFGQKGYSGVFGYPGNFASRDIEASGGDTLPGLSGFSSGIGSPVSRVFTHLSDPLLEEVIFKSEPRIQS